MLDYISLGILIFVGITIFYGIIAIHDIPYEMAKHRNHRFSDGGSPGKHVNELEKQLGDLSERIAALEGDSAQKAVSTAVPSAENGGDE